MWNIKGVVTRRIIPIELSSLFHTITVHEGIFLFSARIPGGKNIAGFNPLVKVTDTHIMYQHTKERVAGPLQVMDSLIKGLNPGHDAAKTDAGFMGYISYDYKDRLEEAHLYKNPVPGLLPDIYFALFEHYLIFRTGHEKTDITLGNTHCSSTKVKIITLIPSFSYTPVPLETLLMGVSGQRKKDRVGGNGALHSKESVKKKSIYEGTSLPQKAYEQAVAKTIDYIKAGDIYQANITRSIYGKTDYTPVELGLRLYYSNRIDFGVFGVVGDRYIISTSPERFFRIRNNTIVTSPIKGTIERTGRADVDILRKNELLGSEKNRAELAMIVDLLRNDISKICKQGSVKVRGFPILKELYNVYHLVADIEGRLSESITLSDIMQALFPGGSISGCPKIRACQIIEELEKVGRGLYTGSFGYYTFQRDMDFNIMIRTLFISGSSFSFNVGGGITLLSDPRLEYEETIYKAKPIWDALSLEEIPEERYCLKET